MDHANQEDKENLKEDKVYKISYLVNMLPALGEHVQTRQDGSKHFLHEDVSVLQMCIDSGQLGLFELGPLQQLIQYRWDQFALKF